MVILTMIFECCNHAAALGRLLTVRSMSVTDRETVNCRFPGKGWRDQ